MMDSAVQKNTGADIFSNVDQHEIFLRLRRAAELLSLGSQVDIVFKHDGTVNDLVEHGAKRNRSPAFQRTDRKDAAFLHIGDCGHADDQGEKLVPCLFLVPEQSFQLVSDVPGDGLRRCLPFSDC